MDTNKIKSTMPYLFNLLLMLALLVGISVPDANAAGTQSSKFEYCILNEDGLNCEDKMSVTFPVSFGLSYTMDAVNNSPTPGMSETVRIEATKTALTRSYPLRYLHTVAYYPTEIVTQVPHSSSGCPACLSCEREDGFCVERTSAELAGAGAVRGEELAAEPATTENPYATAHTLDMGEVFFDGYEIGQYTEDFGVKITTIKGSEVEDLNLSPNVPVAQTVDGGFSVRAELLGDLGEYRGAPELDNYILYIPSAPEGHPLVNDYQNNMLLVPREEVSFDGSEPDKVGVSFKTFRTLGSDYRVTEAGDGLHNQLFQKQNSDLHKLTLDPNAETRYLLQGQRDFRDSMTFKTGMEKILRHQVKGIQNSLVSLTMDDVEIKEINTQSVGIITDAYVKTFDSMSKNGTMVVEIRNEGDYPTDYIVTVSHCTMNIAKNIPAQARSLNPEKNATFRFDIDTVYNLETSNECLVRLSGPTGITYDKLWVVFDTQKHGTSNSWDLRQKNQGSDFKEGETCDEPQPLPGDFNGDGCVDSSDYQALITVVRAGGTDPQYNLNNDGAVDISDVRYLVTLFTNPNGAPCP